jgi:hypothetical protein
VLFRKIRTAACAAFSRPEVQGGGRSDCSRESRSINSGAWRRAARPPRDPHKTEAMYRRYNIVSEQDIRAALVKTQEYLDTNAR